MIKQKPKKKPKKKEPKQTDPIYVADPRTGSVGQVVQFIPDEVVASSLVRIERGMVRVEVVVVPKGAKHHHREGDRVIWDVTI